MIKHGTAHAPPTTFPENPAVTASRPGSSWLDAVPGEASARPALTVCPVCEHPVPAPVQEPALPASSGRTDKFRRRLAAWLTKHHSEPVDVHDLAAVLGFSVRRVQILCMHEFGVTPMQLLRRVRLFHARRILLAEGADISVAEVGRRVGIPHPSRFSRHYKQRFGELPSQTMRNPPKGHWLP
jgi:transcriptional regulator GlxA family with amidase domain